MKRPTKTTLVEILGVLILGDCVNWDCCVFLTGFCACCASVVTNVFVCVRGGSIPIEKIRPPNRASIFTRPIGKIGTGYLT